MDKKITTDAPLQRRKKYEDHTAQALQKELTPTVFIMSEKQVFLFAHHEVNEGEKDYCDDHSIKKKSVSCCNQQFSAVTSPTSCMKGAASEASRSKTLAYSSANLGMSRFKHFFTKKPKVEDEANYDSINRIGIDPSINGDGHDVTKKSTAHYDTRSHSSACSATSNGVKISTLLKLRSKEHSISETIPATVLPNLNPNPPSEGGTEGEKSNHALLLTSAFMAKAEDGRKERRMQGSGRTTRQCNSPALIVVAAEATCDKDVAGADHISNSNQKCDTNVLTYSSVLASSVTSGTAGIEGNVFLFVSLSAAKEEKWGCNDGVSFMINRSKKMRVSLYPFFFILEIYFVWEHKKKMKKIFW